MAQYKPEYQPQKVNPTVAQLCSPETRDDALRQIISWQKYRGEPSYVEKEAKPVKSVVVCPQPEGPPIFATFLESPTKKPMADNQGHVVLIDADGTLIPYYSAANLLDGVFEDVNGDEIIESVRAWRYGVPTLEPEYEGVEILHVIPATRQQRPLLRVAYNKGWPSVGQWSWELAATNRPSVSDIVLGPVSQISGSIIAEVVYTWLASEHCYVGSPGRYDAPFLRLDTEPTDALPRYRKRP